ncbi:oxidoreductase [Rhodococcus qingshengii]|uniref:oxidoreductase n=1 Tax=Rhodococcus qingshengii TaxID=334542 RepID=UPI0027E372A7|nr:1,2-oxophytodienoate reductase [Rhodococcus qingshengii]
MSTSSQDAQLQLDALVAAGVQKRDVFADVTSGSRVAMERQFLSPNSNHRTDQYGGSVENRSRFIIEVAAAVAEEIGADRVGIRISPSMPLCGINEGDIDGVRAQYRHLVGQLAPLNLAYLHVHHVGDDELLRSLRNVWPTAMLVVRFGRVREQIANDIDAGLADIAPLGQFALANPDIVDRLRREAPLNALDPTTLYGGGEVGYTDYPALVQADYPARNQGTLRFPTYVRKSGPWSG